VSGLYVGYVTPGFSDPFGMIRAFMQLPFSPCVVFNESDVVEPTGFAGLPGGNTLGAADMGYGNNPSCTEAGGISLDFHAGADTFKPMFKLSVVSCHGLDRQSRGGARSR
jgi:hypothetical protein